MLKPFLLVLSLAMASGVCAQQSASERPLKTAFVPEHEFRLSAGAYPLFVGDLSNWDSCWSEDSFATSKRSQGSTFTTGALTASYGYRCLRWLDIGLALSYTNEYYRMYAYENSGSVELDRRHMNFVSVLPTVRFTFLRARSVRLYASIGMGITFAQGQGDEFRSRTTAALQFTYLGISAGRRVFGFAELGAGAQGVLIGGVGYRFNAKKQTR